MLRDFCKRVRAKPDRTSHATSARARAVSCLLDQQRRVVEAQGLLVGRCMNILHRCGPWLHGRDIMRHEHLIERVLPSRSFFRGTSRGQFAIVAKQCWTLEARRGDTIVRRDVRLAEFAER